MQCTNKRCRYPIPPHMRECPVCREAVGFPNVRACDTPDEKVALDARYRNAMRSARGKGSRTILRRFEDAVGRSKAVICRSLSVVQRFMSDDEQLYNTFYNMVDSNARIPEDNRWDRSREAVDAMLFPHYHRHMCFAALSLNDKGPTGYGDHCMVLRTAFIANRASTFEENTYVFAEKHRLLRQSLCRQVTEQLGMIEPGWPWQSWNRHSALALPTASFPKCCWIQQAKETGIWSKSTYTTPYIGGRSRRSSAHGP